MTNCNKKWIFNTSYNERTTIQQITDKIIPLNPNSIINGVKLFTKDSPHSNYNCSDLTNAKCGDRP